MNSETKTCQNCKQQFVIEPEDFNFYKKIQVPVPTFCPECRMVRRMLWRNERTLYKRKCQAPGHNEDFLSIYHPESSITVVDHEYWWSDQWDPFSYGREYDFQSSFFEQFESLRNHVPFMNLSVSNMADSEYCNVADQVKGSYMSSALEQVENVLYCNRVWNSKDCTDSYVCFKSELCYENVSCTDCYHLSYSLDCQNCTDSYFLYDCNGCSNCLGCTNLRNKHYYIFNKPYSKEEYKKKFAAFNVGSFASIEILRREFQNLQKTALHRHARIIRSTNVTGNNIENSKNVKYAFDITAGAEDSKYIHFAGITLKDSYDGGPGVGANGELLYEAMDTGLQSSRVMFSNVVYGSRNTQYVLNCHNCSDVFGCIGLRNKEYCILNKQYSKEEYERLLPRVIEHMNEMPYLGKKGRKYKYGDYFPLEIAPFAYNEAISQDYFPLAKEDTLERSYIWRTRENRQYNITKKVENLPDNIRDVDDSILSEIIECIHKAACEHGCAGAFRITPAELQFYRRLAIPLPRICFSCRHARRLSQRNPMKLWHRKCMCDYTVYPNTVKHNHHPEGSCPNEFETSYAPERPEIVYCDQCYNAEVA